MALVFTFHLIYMFGLNVFQDKDSKVAFLQKAIDIVGESLFQLKIF